ncbi:hypothetical protein N665_1725s0002 [Sinapis alba]|nr:hypothetical protein N665_1725s0002 [Sinapis alba]
MEINGGGVVVDFLEEITKDPTPLWTSYLVEHFISHAPHIVKVHATINQLWTSKEKPAKIDVQFINPKTVLFCVEDKQMRLRILKRYFFHIADIPLVVHEWTLYTKASKPYLTAIHLWVDLKGIPEKKTVKIHLNTMRFTRLDVARLLVVLNLKKPLSDKINIRGTDTIISISYPRLPQSCTGCQKWGHLMKDCRQINMGTKEHNRKPKGKLIDVQSVKEVNLPQTAT